MNKIINAINWNDVDTINKVFWNQNVRQFWVDEEIPLIDDKVTWVQLSSTEQEVYKKVLMGLTLLDTNQGSIGMPQIALKHSNPYSKAILSFMGTMEHMHAKSYSSIFSTFCTKSEIEELFAWGQQNELLKNKMKLVLAHYSNINNAESLYISMVCSVLLESYLFYSGFFYPLYLAGKGKLINSGDIINLIIRDEAIHGAYVGLLAQHEFSKFSEFQQSELNKKVADIIIEIEEHENKYTKSLYDSISLTDQVEIFSKYNLDKSLMNLGKPAKYNIDASTVNPMVLKGLSTETKSHDFFSNKGNGYIKTTNVESINDDDFNF